MGDMDISLEDTPKPKKSDIRKRQSKVKSNLTLGQRIQIEEAFFKINFYFGGSLETEIQKVIPRLIEEFKDRDEDDMDLGDMAGMVNIIRMSTRKC
jgi:hypothetical protein